MRRDDAISALRGHLPKLRRDFGVRRLALFGSTARDEAREDSDLDLLVDFESGPTFDSFMGLKFFLEDQLGRRVELVTPDALKPRMRPVVEREAVDVAYPRDWRLYADDIIECCAKVGRFVKGMNYEAFVADERTRDAVIRNIEVIGEAAKNLPDEVIAQAPGVEWRKIRGMRDVVAHGYFGIDLKVVWSVVTTKLDDLEAAVRTMLR